MKAAFSETYIALAKEGRPFVQVSVWRGYANEMLEIFSNEGYALKHVTHRMEGDKSYTQDVTYEFIFEKRPAALVFHTYGSSALSMTPEERSRVLVNTVSDLEDAAKTRE